MSQHTQLSLEQKFTLRSFETQVERMSPEQAKEFLIKLFEQMLLKETAYKQFIKKQWGLDSISLNKSGDPEV